MLLVGDGKMMMEVNGEVMGEDIRWGDDKGDDGVRGRVMGIT